MARQVERVMIAFTRVVARCHAHCGAVCPGQWLVEGLVTCEQCLFFDEFVDYLTYRPPLSIRPILFSNANAI